MRKLLLALFLFFGYSSIAQINSQTHLSSEKQLTPPPCSNGWFPSIYVDASTPNNGIISVQSVQGATFPITVSWIFPDNSIHTGNPISALTLRGTYRFRITDATGCTSHEIDIFLGGCVGLDEISASATSYGITALNNNDGIIDLDVSGGTEKYKYQWSGPNNFSDTTEDVVSLIPGTYSVTITDSLCNYHYMDSLTIDVPGFDICNSADRATTLLEKNEDSQDSASITAHVIGGIAPYTYQWTLPDSTTITTQDSTLFPIGDSGMYSVYITDSAGCEIGTFIDSMYKCVGLDDIELSYILQTTHHPNAGGGGVDLQINGGSGDFSVQWSGPNGFASNSEDINGLLAGQYNVLVSDNVCPSLNTTGAAHIWVTSVTELELADNIQVYPSPNRGTFTLKIDNLRSHATLSIRNIVGQSIYQEQLETNNIQKQISLTNTAAGLYFIEIINEKGNKDTIKMVIQ